MGLFQRKKEYVPKQGLMKNAIDYSIYKFSILEYISYTVLGASIGVALGYLFYENLIVCIIAATLCAISIIPIRRRQIIEKRRKKLLLEFKDALESLSTSIGAGNNIQDSFRYAEADMITQYLSDSLISKELHIINTGIANNINVEELLLDFGERSDIEDIKSFATVFETCYRQGGDMKEVIKNTHQIIVEKIEISLEIQTLVSSKVGEQNIMLLMPVIFVILFKSMGRDMIDLTSGKGLMSTTLALIIFAASYFISKKILDIKV